MAYTRIPDLYQHLIWVYFVQNDITESERAAFALHHIGFCVDIPRRFHLLKEKSRWKV